MLIECRMNNVEYIIMSYESVSRLTSDELIVVI